MNFKILSTIYYNLFSKKILNYYKDLSKFEILNFEVNHAYQQWKLQKLVFSAIKNVPYYSNCKISLKKFSYEEFSKLPILTKDNIRDEVRELISKNYKDIASVKANTSGGSTGEPVKFFQTDFQKLSGHSNYLYALKLNNVDFLDKSVDLWGAERDMYNSKLKFNIRELLHNKIQLNTFVLNNEIIKKYIFYLNRIKPNFIKAYVHSIYEIAKFININKVSISFKPIIHCSTGPLYPEMKLEIEKAFNYCHIYSFYGSREVSAIATEVLDKKGMYVLFDNVFVEILNNDFIPVKEGEEGEIYITTLNNFYMPLIRYKIGDRAIKGDNIDFGTLRLEKVVGRTLGVIYKEDGTSIDGQFFTTLFFSKEGIRSFQLVQKTKTLCHLFIVKSNKFSEIELNDIILRLNKELPNTQIEVKFVEKINLTSTGKIMYVYSEIFS
ncbi:Coenzyme F390 synthetase [Indibacter alkaliphilus LW1]|uniref:Coenzyme F390 synthetase n=1 Tax=Indibacter alkaliphilus (strain CCUG 57479 / KCTC 22604 / LW1) TaxID=1189612 RepID=S2DA46_INDAL|nr:phenylacetate--CoA ligase family protein [Indibacter alkaliphilus]EOZ93860.1 Coenzyme F390 synthetase [Indibacter alkaliphilus LW1]